MRKRVGVKREDPSYFQKYLGYRVGRFPINRHEPAEGKLSNFYVMIDVQQFFTTLFVEIFYGK